MKLNDIFKLDMKSKGGNKLFDRIMNRYGIPKSEYTKIKESLNNQSGGGERFTDYYYFDVKKFFNYNFTIEEISQYIEINENMDAESAMYIVQDFVIPLVAVCGILNDFDTIYGNKTANNIEMNIDHLNKVANYDMLNHVILYNGKYVNDLTFDYQDERPSNSITRDEIMEIMYNSVIGFSKYIKAVNIHSGGAGFIDSKDDNYYVDSLDFIMKYYEQQFIDYKRLRPFYEKFLISHDEFWKHMVVKDEDGMIA